MLLDKLNFVKETIKRIYKKSADSECVKFAKKLFSKKALDKCVTFINRWVDIIYRRASIILAKVVFEVADRFKATNFYAYSKRWMSAYENSSVRVKVGAVSAFAVSLLLIGFVSSGATLAYDISYKGQVIGTVSSKKLCVAAVNLAVNEIDGGNNEISTPKYKLVLTLKNRLATKQVLKTAILENTDSVVFADLLKVDGNNVIYVESGKLEKYLNEYRDSFNIEGAKSKSQFVETVSIQTGYFVTDKVYTLEEAKSIVNQSVTVQTEATVVSEQEIPFGTTTTKTSSKVLGYSAVVTSGVKGTRLNTDSVVLVNGTEIERVNISSVVTKEPANEVVMVGTAKSTASAAQKAAASAYGFIFPIDKSVKWTVSSYFGDGRGHKGVDICAPYKSNIYAVSGGTVTYASYRNDYGYMVIIDHGNGLSTVYAHASVLAVEKGDKVSKGEVIALVGSTGNSSGNHVHFEVRKGETKLNPADYIGL